MSFLQMRLTEPEFEYRLLGIAPEKLNGAVMIPHDLAGKRETDSGTFLLRSEEWNEYLFLSGYGDRFSVVGNTDDDFVISPHPG